jgi:hypothetical protein
MIFDRVIGAGLASSEAASEGEVSPTALKFSDNGQCVIDNAAPGKWSKTGDQVDIVVPKNETDILTAFEVEQPPLDGIGHCFVRQRLGKSGWNRCLGAKFFLTLQLGSRVGFKERHGF